MLGLFGLFMLERMYKFESLACKHVILMDLLVISMSQISRESVADHRRCVICERRQLLFVCSPDCSFNYRRLIIQPGDLLTYLRPLLGLL